MIRWQMTTENSKNMQAIQQAGDILSKGGLVAFPTETVYGLGANALNEMAVSRVFAAKQRPADNPLIVHIADLDQLQTVTIDADNLSRNHKRLMDVFWPGPLTLLFQASAKVAPSVHPGTDLVGVRMPDHPIALDLIRRAGCPIAAPSANTSGKPSPTTAAAVEEDLAEAIDGLIDGGACGVGVESTVLLLEEERATILRPGGITQEMLANVVDVPVVYDAHLIHTDRPPLAPGMKYRHYAPNARVHVWWGEPDEIYAAMRLLLSTDDETPDTGDLRPALIAPRDFINRYEFQLPGSQVAGLDEEKYAAALAKELYSLLRRFDHASATDILIHGVNPVRGIGTAVMNRLMKAAEGRVFRV